MFQHRFSFPNINSYCYGSELDHSVHDFFDESLLALNPKYKKITQEASVLSWKSEDLSVLFEDPSSLNSPEAKYAYVNRCNRLSSLNEVRRSTLVDSLFLNRCIRKDDSSFLNPNNLTLRDRKKQKVFSHLSACSSRNGVFYLIHPSLSKADDFFTITSFNTTPHYDIEERKSADVKMANKKGISEEVKGLCIGQPYGMHDSSLFGVCMSQRCVKFHEVLTRKSFSIDDCLPSASSCSFNPYLANECLISSHNSCYVNSVDLNALKRDIHPNYHHLKCPILTSYYTSHPRIFTVTLESEVKLFDLRTSHHLGLKEPCLNLFSQSEFRFMQNELVQKSLLLFSDNHYHALISDSSLILLDERYPKNLLSIKKPNLNSTELVHLDACNVDNNQLLIYTASYFSHNPIFYVYSKDSLVCKQFGALDSLASLASNSLDSSPPSLEYLKYVPEKLENYRFKMPCLGIASFSPTPNHSIFFRITALNDIFYQSIFDSDAIASTSMNSFFSTVSRKQRNSIWLNKCQKEWNKHINDTASSYVNHYHIKSDELFNDSFSLPTNSSVIPNEVIDDSKVELENCNGDLDILFQEIQSYSDLDESFTNFWLE